jgi:heptosyltransferase-1
MKIAIVKLSALGDIIHTMVALQFIKNHYPDSQIDWIVDQQFKSVLENNPHIRKIHTVSFKKAKKEKSILLILKELNKIRVLEKYDLVIDAQGLIKSAIVAKLIPSKITVGFDINSIREKLASYFYNFKVAISYDSNSIDRNLRVICNPLAISFNSIDIENKDPFLFSDSKIKVDKGRYIVFIIGSTWASRNYPIEKFVEVADLLQKNCIVLWGNSEERKKAEWMSEQSAFISTIPKLNLNEVKAVISNSSLLIGNDSGPSHMAWGLNIPSIILFGPTPVNRVFQSTINQVLKSNSEVNHFKLNKQDFTIREIEVNDIVRIAEELL